MGGTSAACRPIACPRQAVRYSRRWSASGSAPSRSSSAASSVGQVGLDHVRDPGHRHLAPEGGDGLLPDRHHGQRLAAGQEVRGHRGDVGDQRVAVVEAGRDVPGLLGLLAVDVRPAGALGVVGQRRLDLPGRARSDRGRGSCAGAAGRSPSRRARAARRRSARRATARSSWWPAGRPPRSGRRGRSAARPGRSGWSRTSIVSICGRPTISNCSGAIFTPWAA